MDELKQFVDQCRAAGKTDAEISGNLKEAGWGDKEISSVLSHKMGKSFFAPGRLWDIFVLAPIVYVGVFIIFYSGFVSKFFLNFGGGSSSAIKEWGTLFAVIFPIHILMLTIGLLSMVYLIKNWKTIAPSGSDSVKWIAAILFLSPAIIPFIHFRYLRQFSLKRSAVLTLIPTLFLLASSLYLFQGISRQLLNFRANFYDKSPIFLIGSSMDIALRVNSVEQEDTTARKFPCQCGDEIDDFTKSLVKGEGENEGKYYHRLIGTCNLCPSQPRTLYFDISSFYTE